LAFATSTIWKNPETRKIILVVSTGQTIADNDFVIDIKGMGNPYANSTDVGSKIWHVRACALVTPGDPNSGCNPPSDPALTDSPATITRRGGVITDWTITANNYSASAAIVEYTAAYTASTTLNIGDKIHFNFPIGYTLTNATTSAQTIVVGGTAQIAADAIATSTANGTNQIILTVSGSAIDPSATSTVTSNTMDLKSID